MAIGSLEEMKERRPAWVPSWMFTIPDVWGAFGSEHSMKVEEFRDGDEYVVRAELPGIDPDRDVHLDVVDGSLRLRAERRVHREDVDEDQFRSEFEYGSFFRQMPLPSGATEDDVKATYTDGILEIRVPVDDEVATSTKIPVTRT